MKSKLKGKIKPKIKKFGPGGTTNPPITVHDPNDPRLRAYQDSLDLQQAGVRDSSFINNNSWEAHEKFNPGYDKPYKDLLKMGLNDVPIDNYTRQYNSWLQQKLGNSKTATATFFSKPVQPYQYQPDTRIPQNYNGEMNVTESNKTPWGQRMTEIPRGKKESDYQIKTYSYDNNGLWTYVPIEKPIQATPYGLNNLTTQSQPDLNKIPLTNTKLPLPKPDWFSRLKQQGEVGEMEYFDNKTGKPIKEFGGMTTVNKSNDMKLNKKSPAYKKLMKFGGILRKAGNGEITPTIGGGGGKPIDITQSKFNPNNYGVDELNGAGYDFTTNNNQYQPPVDPNQINIQMPAYQTGVDDYVYSNDINGTQKNKEANLFPNKTNNGVNYTNGFGHSTNYWGDFVSNSFKATDSLAHAIPDTIGDIKSNRFTERAERNTDKINQTMPSYTPPNTGYGQRLRKFGGKISDYKADGGNNMNGNVEIEGGETVSLNNGLTEGINGPSHNAGGIPMSLPEGTKIFSEKLKDPETKKSYSKLAKKFSTTKEQEILDNPKLDKIAKETAQMQMDRKNQESDRLFALQEKNKVAGVHGVDVQKQAIEDYMPGMSEAGNGMYIPALQTMALLERKFEGGGEIPLPATMALLERKFHAGGEIPDLGVMALLERKFKNGGLKKYANAGKTSNPDYVWSNPNDNSVTPTGVKNPAGNQADWLNWQSNIDRDNEAGNLNMPKLGAEDITRYGLGKDESNPQGLLNASYQEQYYDRLLDTPEGRKQLASMWDDYGVTEKGKTLGLQGNIPSGGLSAIKDDKQLTNFLNNLRPAYIEGKLSSRKAGDIPNGKLPVNQTQATGVGKSDPSNVGTDSYNSVNNKRGRLGMLPTIVGIPNPQKEAMVNFRHINPNPIEYRPETNLGEISEIQNATANLSRFLPATSEGIGIATNMAANNADKFNQSAERVHNINQRGQLGVDEANQRNLQGVNEFNAKNDLEQLNHITGRAIESNKQSNIDRKEALAQINTNTQFANTADFLGRTVNPSDYYGGNADLMREAGLTGKENADEARRKIVKYNYEKEFGKVERAGAETTSTKKFGGKIKPTLKKGMLKKVKKS